MNTYILTYKLDGDENPSTYFLYGESFKQALYNDFHEDNETLLSWCIYDWDDPIDATVIVNNALESIFGRNNWATYVDVKKFSDIVLPPHQNIENFSSKIIDGVV